MNSISLTRKYIDALQELARNKNISILDLCKVLDISPQSFYRWRGGTVTMTLKTVSNLNSKLEEEFEESIEVFST